MIAFLPFHFPLSCPHLVVSPFASPFVSSKPAVSYVFLILSPLFPFPHHGSTRFRAFPDSNPSSSSPLPLSHKAPQNLSVVWSLSECFFLQGQASPLSANTLSLSLDLCYRALPFLQILPSPWFSPTSPEFCCFIVFRLGFSSPFPLFNNLCFLVFMNPCRLVLSPFVCLRGKMTLPLLATIPSHE